LGLNLSEGLGPTRAPDHEHAFSFLADDCETLTQIQALSALVDSKNAQSYRLVKEIGFVDHLLQQSRANAKPSKRLAQIELYQPQVVWFVFDSYQSDLFCATQDYATR
jgi:hypothetical protein